MVPDNHIVHRPLDIRLECIRVRKKIGIRIVIAVAEMLIQLKETRILLRMVQLQIQSVELDIDAGLVQARLDRHLGNNILIHAGGEQPDR